MPFLARRNKLSLPYGQGASIDYGHPAANGIVRFSGVAKNGNFVDLTQGGKPGTVSNGPLFTNLDSRIGRVINFNTSSPGGISFSGRPTVADASLTMAGIVDIRPTGNFQQNVFGSSANGAGVFLCIQDEPIGLIQLQVWGNIVYGNAVPCTINGGGTPTVPGVPYFIAVSIDATTLDFISTNLLTGQVVTQHLSGQNTAQVASSGTYYVGNSSAGSNQVGAFTTLGGVAAAMYSNVRTTAQQLAAWAEDPWSFWYPQWQPSTVGVAAAGGSGLVITANITVELTQP